MLLEPDLKGFLFFFFCVEIPITCLLGSALTRTLTFGGLTLTPLYGMRSLSSSEELYGASLKLNDAFCDASCDASCDSDSSFISSSFDLLLSLFLYLNLASLSSLLFRIDSSNFSTYLFLSFLYA